MKKRLFVISVIVSIAIGVGLAGAALSAQPPSPSISDEDLRKADIEFKDPGISPPMDRSLAMVIAADHLKTVYPQEVVDQVTASSVSTRFILFSQRPAITDKPAWVIRYADVAALEPYEPCGGAYAYLHWVRCIPTSLYVLVDPVHLEVFEHIVTGRSASYETKEEFCKANPDISWC